MLIYISIRAPHEHRPQIPSLINHLLTHDQYSTFEEHYISITRDYYIAESQRLSDEQKKDPQAFFRHVQARIQEEEERSKGVLPVGSWGKLRETTEKALWDDRLGWLATESTYTSYGQRVMISTCLL